MDNHKYKILKGYIPEIDGLRAIAIAAVLIFHISSTYLPGGFSGVDVFFVISGYVVSRALYQHSNEKYIIFLSGFFARRIKRIIPALAICILATTIFTVLFIPASWLSEVISKTGLLAYFGASNFALIIYQDGYFSPRTDYNPFTHTWSLGVEEQFYLILPTIFFIWLHWQKHFGIRRYIAQYSLIALMIGSVACAYLWKDSRSLWAFYLLPSRFWELASGILLFQLQTSGKLIYKLEWQSLFSFSAGMILIFAGYLFCNPEDFPYPWALLPVLGSVLVIASASSHSVPSVCRRSLGHPVLVYIGRLSYSLYLWHWPVYTLMRWTTGLETPHHKIFAIAASFLLAAASYHFLETPIRTSEKLKPHWRAISAGAIATALLFISSKSINQHREKISLSVTADTKTWYPYAFPSNNATTASTKELAGRKIFVIGDSHSGAYSTMLQEASENIGVEIVKIPVSHCPMGSLLHTWTTFPECSEIVNDAVNTIKSTASQGDIVFFASLRTYRLCDQWVLYDADYTLELSKNNDTNKELLKSLRETQSIVSEFNSIGVKVLIDAPKPVLSFPPFRCSDWFNKDNPICRNQAHIERSRLLAIRQPVMNSLEQLALNNMNVTVWDPFPTLCPDEICTGWDRSGFPLFFDGDHLSAHGNRVLYPEFENILISMEKNNRHAQSSFKPATTTSQAIAH